jgi:predicted RNA-binding protein YlqC (UPF0109 family)
MQELVELIARTIAEDPDQVEVEHDDDVLLLRVSDRDLGQIIGRRGRTAKAIRTLLRASGSETELEIASHDGGTAEEDE